MAIVKANTNSYELGEAYQARLQDEVDKNFAILLSLLSSYWKSTVDGPNYTKNLKAMAIALSQIRISLGEIFNDADYAATRGEFLNQVVTKLVFPDSVPDLENSDIEFREFLTKIIPLYFKGSVPSSVSEGVSLLTGGDVRVYAMFEEARKPGSGYDISDQFNFGIDVILDSPGQTNPFLADRNVRILLQIMRPAHTLYRLRFILRDEYLGNKTDPVTGLPFQPNKLVDSPEFDLSDHSYDDFRKFVLGVKNVDYLGVKVSHSVTAEDHSSDWLE